MGINHTCILFMIIVIDIQTHQSDFYVVGRNTVPFIGYDPLLRGKTLQGELRQAFEVTTCSNHATCIYSPWDSHGDEPLLTCTRNSINSIQRLSFAVNSFYRSGAHYKALR